MTRPRSLLSSRLRSFHLPLLLLAAWAAAPLAAGPAAAAAEPPRERITVLETSDLHVNLLPWDYARGRSADWGLARVASRVAAIRKETPNVILLDGGDTIQGTPIGWLHARRPDGTPDPMAAAMSEMRYDAMAVGNHDFNFGLDVLRKAEKESTFPWLSANTRYEKDGSAAFPEYLVKEVAGVRVGILGLTTPNIPNWEPEPNRRGLKWEDPVDTARRLVPVLRGKERCDVVVVLIHSGLEIDPVTGEPNGTAHENRVASIAKDVPGIDLILMGHTHRKVPPTTRVFGVPVAQPGRWGEALARVDLDVERRDGSWKVTGVSGELLPSDASVPVDPAIAAIARPQHERALAYLDEPIATAAGAFPGERARLEDTALLDLVNDTQRAATGAQLSMTSLLPGRFEGFPAGPLTVRQVYALYPYENQLSVLEVDGATLKAVLEHAASFYGSAAWENGKLVLTPKPGMIPYNFDVLQGASYRIDPTAPEGSRIRDLRFQGREVKPDDTFTLAVNSYRAQGSGGYGALKKAKLVRTYNDEIRELIIDRLRKGKTVVPVVDENWFVAPEADWAPQAPRRPAPAAGEAPAPAAAGAAAGGGNR